VLLPAASFTMWAAFSFGSRLSSLSRVMPIVLPSGFPDNVLRHQPVVRGYRREAGKYPEQQSTNATPRDASALLALVRFAWGLVGMLVHALILQRRFRGIRLNPFSK